MQHIATPDDDGGHRRLLSSELLGAPCHRVCACMFVRESVWPCVCMFVYVFFFFLQPGVPDVSVDGKDFFFMIAGSAAL